MKLEQTFTVTAPIEQVWAALIDVERVAPCLPGAEITGQAPDGGYEGTFSVKLGPATASYRGSLKMESLDEAARVATMSAKGTDKRGQGGASASIVSTMRQQGDETLVEVISDFTITGRLARFGRGGMIEDISKRLMRDFASCLQSTLAAEPAPAAPAGETAADAAVAEALAATETPAQPEPEPAADPPEPATDPYASVWGTDEPPAPADTPPPAPERSYDEVWGTQETAPLPGEEPPGEPAPDTPPPPAPLPGEEAAEEAAHAAPPVGDEAAHAAPPAAGEAGAGEAGAGEAAHAAPPAADDAAHAAPPAAGDSGAGEAGAGEAASAAAGEGGASAGEAAAAAEARERGIHEVDPWGAIGPTSSAPEAEPAPDPDGPRTESIPPPSAASRPPVQPAKPVKGFSLMLSVMWERIKRSFSRKR